LDVHALETALCTDRQLFRRCETSLRAVASADPKLNALLDLLRELDAGVMVFTQYRDTAIYLWQRLQRTFRVGLVHGTDARLGARRAARTTVIECFAPRANGAQPPGDRLRVDVLIATDVLSEGLNLQDAHTVVSYDIPWNPVTLMQRLGRVDRLASPHARVQLCNFLPDRGLEDWLHLMERVEQKLLMIDRTIGGDGTLLERADSLQPGTVAGVTGQRLLPDATLELQEQVELLRARWLRIGAFKPRRGPVVSSLPGHVEGWLIAVHDDTRVRLLFVDDLGNARDDVRAACQLLDAALDCPGIPSAPGAAVPWAQMQDWLGAERAAVALAPANRHNSEERRVTRLLLNAMDAAAPNPRLARRAERLLNLLASPSQPTCRDRLPALLACCGPAPDAAELITSLEDLYARAREPGRARERLRLIAAIQVVR
ncbi:MAG: C-terminal helicase domain-containing protein, partial [Longimicrobiales bacterium]